MRQWRSRRALRGHALCATPRARGRASCHSELSTCGPCQFEDYMLRKFKAETMSFPAGGVCDGASPAHNRWGPWPSPLAKLADSASRAHQSPPTSSLATSTGSPHKRGGSEEVWPLHAARTCGPPLEPRRDASASTDGEPADCEKSLAAHDFK